jgi:hypothetical protein
VALLKEPGAQLDRGFFERTLDAKITVLAQILRKLGVLLQTIPIDQFRAFVILLTGINVDQQYMRQHGERLRGLLSFETVDRSDPLDNPLGGLETTGAERRTVHRTRPHSRIGTIEGLCELDATISEWPRRLDLFFNHQAKLREHVVRLSGGLGACKAEKYAVPLERRDLASREL